MAEAELVNNGVARDILCAVSVPRHPGINGIASAQDTEASHPPAPNPQTGPNLRALLLPDSSLAPMDLHGHQLQGEGSTLSALRSLVTKARVQASLTGTLISAGFWVENAAHSNFLTLATIPLWG